MKRLKIALSERQRVCDFSFISVEFINFCRQMSILRVFVFPPFYRIEKSRLHKKIAVK